MEKLKELLSAKFQPKDILWRVQRSGETNNKIWALVLAYVDARAIMERLDDVMGIDCWKDSYRIDANGAICRLELRINNEWIAKENGAEQTDVEAYKGQLSKAFVRCAVNWGIGRYLYDLTESYAFCQEAKPASKDGWHRDKIKDSGKFFYWQEPSLPSWALPEIAQKTKVNTTSNTTPF